MFRIFLKPADLALDELCPSSAPLRSGTASTPRRARPGSRRSSHRVIFTNEKRFCGCWHSPDPMPRRDRDRPERRSAGRRIEDALDDEGLRRAVRERDLDGRADREVVLLRVPVVDEDAVRCRVVRTLPASPSFQVIVDHLGRAWDRPPVANSVARRRRRTSPVRDVPDRRHPGRLGRGRGRVDRDRREVVLRRDRVVARRTDRSRRLVNDAMMPDASVATSVTSVRPIISAAAVDAVRCGLRRVLSRASSPAAPAVLVAGQPSTAARGRTSRDEKSETPRNMRSVPTPIQVSTCFVPRPCAKMP